MDACGCYQAAHLADCKVKMELHTASEASCILIPPAARYLLPLHLFNLAGAAEPSEVYAGLDLDDSASRLMASRRNGIAKSWAQPRPSLSGH